MDISVGDEQEFIVQTAPQTSLQKTKTDLEIENEKAKLAQESAEKQTELSVATIKDKEVVQDSAKSENAVISTTTDAIDRKTSEN